MMMKKNEKLEVRDVAVDAIESTELVEAPEKKQPKKIWLLLAALGPGIVTAMAGNDAGGISTYSTVGAKFGYATLWVIPIMCVLLIVVQMTAARMGAVTGKGFAALIRERFGIRLTALAMLLCVIAAGIYLTVTMLFKINTIEVRTADGVVSEAGGYSSEQILQALGVQKEENIFSFDPAAKAAALEKVFPMLEDIRVERDYPSTVVVRVAEAQPAYAMQTAKGWLTLSAGLKILAADSAQPTGLPTLYGGEPIFSDPGEQLCFEEETPADSSTARRVPPTRPAPPLPWKRRRAISVWRLSAPC